jgi:hypothetical protein
MAKQVVKIADLAQLTSTVDVSDDKQIVVRALSLREMVKLFVESYDAFMPLYAAGLSGDFSVEKMAPFLLTSPEVVAKIIAMASDEPDSADKVEQHMASTVQLIALAEVWKLSVPDPKKASLLLSEVTRLLQSLSEKEGVLIPPPVSPMSLQPQ